MWRPTIDPNSEVRLAVGQHGEMTIQIDPAKQSIDIGIVIRDSEKSLAFYRDLLGCEHTMDMPMPLGGGGVMHRLQSGTTTLKLVHFDKVPTAANPPGGITGAVGLRYFTIWITNLDEAVAAVEAAGHTIVTPIVTVRPGVRIAIMEDPDGNLVELLQNG